MGWGGGGGIEVDAVSRMGGMGWEGRGWDSSHGTIGGSGF